MKTSELNTFSSLILLVLCKTLEARNRIVVYVYSITEVSRITSVSTAIFQVSESLASTSYSSVNLKKRSDLCYSLARVHVTR